MKPVDDGALLAAWLDDGLDQAGRADLARRVAADPRLARTLHDQGAIDGQLRAQGASQKCQQALTKRVLQALSAPEPATAPLVLRRIAREQQRTRQQRLGLRVGLGLAAALVAAVILWPAERTAAEGTRVTVCSGAVHVGADGAATVGALLPPGSTILAGVDGSIALTAADGSRFDLVGPGRLTLASTGRPLRLEAGELAVSAVPQPAETPLSILTPHTLTTVVGTRFRLAVGATATNLQVSAGTVTFGGLIGATLPVHAGERAWALAGREAQSLSRMLFAGDGEAEQTVPFSQAGRLATPPPGNPSRWCLQAETRDWTPQLRQVAAGAYPQALFNFAPELVLEFDYWVSPAVPWASVWIGNCVDFSIQNHALDVTGAGRWRHASIRLATLRAEPDPTGQFIMRRALSGEGIGMLGISIPDGDWNLYVDNVSIVRPEP